MNSFTASHTETAPEQLLARQRADFNASGTPGIRERRRQLARLRAAILHYRKELGEAVNTDFGHRSAMETDILELVVTVQSIDYLTRNLRRFIEPQRRHTAGFYRPAQAYVEYQPLGVVGIMAPWNYPLSLTLIPLATALAAGNRAMLKPSELTPQTSALMQRLLADTFPLEQVAVVLGGPETGAAFSALPFDHLLFTGSTPIGRKVMKAASENLVPVTLELGGKSPVILAPGQVSARNLDNIVFGKLANAGQTCVAPDYALVQEDDLEAFAKGFADSVDRLYPMGSLSPDYSSIISEAHHARLLSLLDDARASGAQVVALGREPERAIERRRTLAPTLVLEPKAESLVMQDEIFGPILPVMTYRKLDEAIDFINSRPRPLALYYFGANDAACRRVVGRTTSGNVGINNTVLHVAQDDLPFGGVGPSGMGAYHGIEGFRAMSHAKGVFAQRGWSPASLVRAPYGWWARLALRLTLGSATPTGRNQIKT